MRGRGLRPDGAERPPLDGEAASRYRGARVLLLGASGFIGRWVGRVLAEAGASLHLVVREAPAQPKLAPSYGLEGATVACDLSESGALTSLVRELEPEIVFNLAGYGIRRDQRDRRSAFRVNSWLVRELCTSLQARDRSGWTGLRLIHVGSALEYGEATGDLRENTRPQPTTLYGRSKLAGTLAVHRAGVTTGLRAATARLFTVYGPGEQSGRLLPALIRTAAQGGDLELTSGAQMRDFTYVGDVAEGLLRLGVSSCQPGEVVNLATGRLTSVQDFARMAARALRLPEERLLFGRLPSRPEEMAHSPVAIRRLRELTGWSPPTSPEAGIRETLRVLDQVGSRS